MVSTAETLAYSYTDETNKTLLWLTAVRMSVLIGLQRDEFHKYWLSWACMAQAKDYVFFAVDVQCLSLSYKNKSVHRASLNAYSTLNMPILFRSLVLWVSIERKQILIHTQKNMAL
jgi:hypothetical protein